MAVFTTDLISGNVYLFKSLVTGGTSVVSGSTYPVAGNYGLLPAAASHTGQIYAILNACGTYVTGRKDAGLYCSNGSSWNILGCIPNYFASNNFQIYDNVDNTKGISVNTSAISGGVFRVLSIQDCAGTIAYLSDVNTRVLKTDFNAYSGTTLTNINTRTLKTDFNTFTGTTLPANYYNKTQINSLNTTSNNKFNTYTGNTGLQQVTAINAATNIQSTFSSGIKTTTIKPSVDSTTAIQINTAGNVPVINVDTISGFTGFGLNNPKSHLHVYADNNITTSAWDVQVANSLNIDGDANIDKNVLWSELGVAKWAAQTYRNEKAKYWYLFNVSSKNNPITVSDTGRVGINNQTNIINYHAATLTGNGLNDLNVGGLYTQSYLSVFQIMITGVTNPNTYVWRISYDGGVSYSSWSSPSACTITTKNLIYGVTLNFDGVTGHTLGNVFEFPAFSQLPVGTFVVSTVGFDEVQTSSNWNAGTVIYKDISASANSASLSNGITIFNTGITSNAIYFGTAIQIDSLFVNLATVGSSVTLITEYWNGTSWVVLNNSNNFLIDGTKNLTQSGPITWEITTMTNWIAAYIPNLVQNGYSLYWLRLRTSTNSTIAPVAQSFARGGDKRFSVFSSPSDFKPAMYIDSLGRMNIGGGNITGCNVFQVNSASCLSVAPVAGGDSHVEFDSEDSSLSTLRLKVASNDTCGTSLEFGRTRGTLNTPLSMLTNDLIGRINFKGRVGTSGSISSQISSQYLGDGSTTRCADLIFSTACGICTANATEKVRINYAGNTGFGISTPTATIHVKSGTTTNAPMKFVSGTLLSSPQAGSVEFLGNFWYGTTTGSTRNTFAFLQSPTFTGTPNLPNGTIFNSLNLNNYILNSGGTNNICLTKTTNFNTYTGNTSYIINNTVTGGTNGLTKSSRVVKLGGNLNQDTTVTGNTYNLTLSSKNLKLCSCVGTVIRTVNNSCITVESLGTGGIYLRGSDVNGVEKTKIMINDSQASIIDSRTSPAGLEYNADYSSTYSVRSLVDKNYVDTHSGGLFPKQAANVATTTNINLSSAPATIDGITLSNGNRVLIKNQTTGSTNGIYVFNGVGSAMTRSTDANTSPQVVNGVYIAILSGSTNKNTSWILNTVNPIVLGSTSLTFVLFDSTIGITGGNGICVIQSGGNYNVATKSPANSSLCSDVTGIYVNPNIAGTGICYTTGVLTIDGANLAGNSICYTGNKFNVNPSGGTLNTCLNSKLSSSAFNSYSGNTLTLINNKLATTIYSTYTGTTVPNTYLTKTNFNTFSGTTLPTNYYTKSIINGYTGATQTKINLKAPIDSPTFTTFAKSVTPLVNDNTTCIATTAWYIGQGATANPLMDGVTACGTSNLFARQDHIHPNDISRLSVATFSGYTGSTLTNINTRLLKTNFNTYSGTTAPATYLSKTNFNSYSGSTLTCINNKLLKTDFNTFSGTTLPSTYYTKTIINGYTGATLTNINTRVLKTDFNTFTGTTLPANYYNKTIINGYTGATLTLINLKAPINAPTFTGIAAAVTAAVNTCTTQIATTAFVLNQGSSSNPLMDAALANQGSSNLYSRQDHVHPSDTSKLYLTGGTVSGTLTTKNLCLSVLPTGGTINDYTLFYNSSDKKVKQIKLTGGSDSYFYTNSDISTSTSSATCIKYLSGASWIFKTGTYQVDFNATIGNSGNGGTTLVKFSCDGAVITSNICYIATGNAGSHITTSMSRDLSMNSGCHCLEIYYWQGGNSACIYSGMIRAKRIC